MSESDTEEPKGVTVYEFVGGKPFFDELVERFYAGVAVDPVLRPMYPEEDLGPAKARLAGFLTQYFGGPDDYSKERGHPRLRMRHFPFAIDVDARNRWFVAMYAAVQSMDTIDEVKNLLLGYFNNSATAMINQEGPASPQATQDAGH